MFFFRIASLDTNIQNTGFAIHHSIGIQIYKILDLLCITVLGYKYTKYWICYASQYWDTNIQNILLIWKLFGFIIYMGIKRTLLIFISIGGSSKYILH